MQLDTLKRAADLASSHPRLFLRKLGARCVPLPARPIKRKVHGVIFEFDLSESWAGRDIARQMFFRMYEESTVVTMKLFLLKEVCSSMSVRTSVISRRWRWVW